MEMPEPLQDRVELRRVTNALAEVLRSRISLPHFRGRLALQGYKSRPKRGLQLDFEAVPVRGVRQRAEQGNSPPQVGARLTVRRAARGALPCSEPVVDSRLCEPCLRVVLGQ